MKRWMAMGLTTLALAGAAAACGGKDEKKTNVVDVDALDFSFAMPGEVQGGRVTLNFANKGKYLHEFAFAKLEDGKTVDDIAAFLETGSEEPPAWMTDIGGVGPIDPGKSIEVTRTLEPGTYVYVCFLPQSDGTPHVALGMVKAFTVTGDSGADAPEADAVITATDDAFQVPDLAAGRRTIELRNEGADDREFFFGAFEDGKTLDDAGQWFQGGMQGAAPVRFLGGVQIVPPGESLVITVDLEAGTTYTVLDSETGATAEFTPHS